MSAPTMRALSGATSSRRLEPRETALIAIDFQQEYFSGKMPIPDGASALDQTNRLVAAADASGMPVFHMQHVGMPGGALFAKDGSTVALHPGLSVAAHHTVLQKTTASSFASTDLHERLQAAGIKTVIVCGLMTHMCVSTTARDARPRGYQVIVAADACATRDIDAWDGGIVAHGALHRAALTALSDSFAEVLRTAQVRALIGQGPAVEGPRVA